MGKWKSESRKWKSGKCEKKKNGKLKNASGKWIMEKWNKGKVENGQVEKRKSCKVEKRALPLFRFSVVLFLGEDMFALIGNARLIFLSCWASWPGWLLVFLACIACVRL